LHRDAFDLTIATDGLEHVAFIGRARFRRGARLGRHPGAGAYAIRLLA
jgi:hypothetical protein